MTTSTETSVHHTIEIAVPVEKAFAVFTEQFDRIKPRDHNLMETPIVETVLEARVGGAVYDRGADGTVCRWGRVVALEPPHRIVFTWDINLHWQIESDPARTSEVEVRFAAAGPDRTRVELEHRHLERHGDGWDGMRSAVASENGWPLYLQRFADVAAA